MTRHKYDESKKMKTRSQTEKMKRNSLELLVETATYVFQGEI
jgi:hypothetical protein